MKEITLVGFVQALFFVIIVLMKKDKELKDYFLAIFFFLVGAELLFQYFYYKGNSVYSTSLIIFDFVYWAFLGPSIFFYTKSVINSNFKFTQVQLFHLVPFFISSIALIYYFTSGKYDSFQVFFHNCTGIIRYILIFVWEYTT
ncbi:MAG: hypothetical protein C0597_10060, partial [Marinilabiliales bacterium]